MLTARECHVMTVRLLLEIHFCNAVLFCCEQHAPSKHALHAKLHGRNTRHGNGTRTGRNRPHSITLDVKAASQ